MPTPKNNNKTPMTLITDEETSPEGTASSPVRAREKEATEMEGPLPTLAHIFPIGI